MSSLAEDLKVSIFETLNDVRRVVNQARQTVNNGLNTKKQDNLAVLDRLLGQLDADETKLKTADVEQVPYFGGDIIKRATDAREKAYQIVDAMRLIGPVEFASDAAKEIGKGLGATLAEFLKQILPYVGAIVAFVLLLGIVYIAARKQQTA